MHDKLQRLFDTLELSRSKILDKVGTLPEDVFFGQVQERKWSIAQILTHLLTAEQVSLGYMKKKSLGIDTVSDSGIVEEMKILVLKISQRIPLKYKAPAVLIKNTPPTLPLHELNRHWTESRRELREFLDAIKAEKIKRKIYKHPVAGRLDVAQALMFYQEHINHHMPQIERLLKNYTRK